MYELRFFIILVLQVPFFSLPHACPQFLEKALIGLKLVKITVVITFLRHKWDNVLKDGPSRICGSQPLKFFRWYGLFKQTTSPSKICRRQPLKKLRWYGLFSSDKAIFLTFYLAHSWIHCPKCFFRVEGRGGLESIRVCQQVQNTTGTIRR